MAPWYFGLLGASSTKSPYFISTFANSTSYPSIFYGSALDSSGKVYLSGYAQNATTSNDAILIKTDPLGEIEWQRFFGGSGNDNGDEVAVDSSGNIYINCYSFSDSSRAVLAKYNSSGTLQWQVGMGTTYAVTRGLSTTGSRIYLGLEPGEFSTQNNFGYARLNSDGTLLVEKELYSSVLDQNNFIYSDSANNVYIGGQTRGMGNPNRVGLVAKYNSSGTLQWQRYWGQTTFNVNATIEAVATDSSGNVYAAARETQQGHIIKWSSSGNFEWQKKISASDYNELYDIAVDSVDNIYVVGRAAFGFGPQGYVAKFDSAGNLQWQRQLHNIGGAETRFNSISFDEFNDLYISGSSYDQANTIPRALVVYLPQDGSLTGDYVLGNDTYTYAPATLAVSASTIEWGGGSLSNRNGSYGTVSSSLVSSAASLTQTITNG